MCLILAFKCHCGKSKTGNGKIYLLVILIGSGYIILCAETHRELAAEEIMVHIGTIKLQITGTSKDSM